MGNAAEGCCGLRSSDQVRDNNGSSNKLEGLRNAINHYQSKNDDGNYDDRIAKLEKKLVEEEDNLFGL